MAEKILLLTGQEKDNESYEFSKIVKNSTNKLFFIYSKIINHLYFNGDSFFHGTTFGNWKNKLSEYKAIIIYDSFGIYTYNVIKYLNKKKYTGRLILYYRNPLYLPETLDLNKIRTLKCEIWTYSQYDSEKFGLIFNPNPLPNIPENIPINSDIVYDFVFIGMDKGRKQLIDSICEKLANYKILKMIMNDGKSCIPFDEYILNTLKAKVIIDISDEKAGPTTRCMEGMLLKRKVFTNCKAIKNYKFYNQKNIFIYGKDNLSDLQNFVSNPFVNIDDYKIEWYSFDNWLNRFNIC